MPLLCYMSAGIDSGNRSSNVDANQTLALPTRRLPCLNVQVQVGVVGRPAKVEPLPPVLVRFNGRRRH